MRQQTIWRNGTHQKVAFTGTAGTIGNAVGTATYAARIVATSDCYYVVGKTPTATTSDIYLPADTIEYIAINPGEKVSAIQDSGGGDLHVTELS